MSKKILLLPGDGIGVEVVAQATRILSFLQSEGSPIEYESALIGGAAIDAEGDPLPQATLTLAKQADAVLLGAVGGEKWDSLPPETRPERGLIRIRSSLGLFANLRPAKSYNSLLAASNLKPEVVRDTDMLIVRELIGGLYYGTPREIGKDDKNRRYGVNTTRYNEDEIKRIAKVAFECAKTRKRHLVSVDKANVLEVSRVWREVVSEVAKEYPDITLEHIYADNAAMQFVRRPASFDVIVAPNMFGDLLSDLAGAIIGSIGLLPSASLNENAKGLFEPIHGSAPDIAGKDIANPLATILSLAMLLRHSLAMESTAIRIEKAVDAVIDQKILTADLATDLATNLNTNLAANSSAYSTTAVTDAVLAEMAR